jgi:hypothetical protein
VLVLGSVDAEAAPHGWRQVVRPPVVQRDAAPGDAAGFADEPAQQNASNAAPSRARTRGNAAPKRPWGAMLGGLAAGLGLAWLAHSLGLGAGFGNIPADRPAGAGRRGRWRMMRRRKPRAPTPAWRLRLPGRGCQPDDAGVAAQYSPANVGNDASARPWERNATPPSTPAANAQPHGSGLSASGPPLTAA